MVQEKQNFRMPLELLNISKKLFVNIKHKLKPYIVPYDSYVIIYNISYVP